jgi:aspartate kinase
VLQIRAVEFAGKYQVPLRVLSTFKDGPGTLITLDEEYSAMEQPVVSGIAFNRDEAKVSVIGVPDSPGVAAQILSAVGDANIEIDVIVQNTSHDHQLNDLTFTVNRTELAKAKAVVEKIAGELNAKSVETDDKITKVSVVGVGMRSHAGVASKMFKTLAEENINIQMISTSEIKISVIIDERYLELGVRALHTAFELDNPLEDQ